MLWIWFQISIDSAINCLWTFNRRQLAGVREKLIFIFHIFTEHPDKRKQIFHRLTISKLNKIYAEFNCELIELIEDEIILSQHLIVNANAELRLPENCTNLDWFKVLGFLQMGYFALNKVKLIYYLVSYRAPKEAKLFMHLRLFDTHVIPFR